MFAQSNDYSGASMVSPVIPKKYKRDIMEPVIVGRQTVFGTRSVVMPGVEVADGCFFGATSLVIKRKKDLIGLEEKFLRDIKNASPQ